jgi:hypothetical protein
VIKKPQYRGGQGPILAIESHRKEEGQHINASEFPDESFGYLR